VRHVLRWMTALTVALAVLALNVFIALELQWGLPTEEGFEFLVTPFLALPLSVAILGSIFEYGPRKGFTVGALLLLTYLNALAFTFNPIVRRTAYPWRLVTAAMQEEHDRLAATARQLGIDRHTETTRAQAEVLEQRLGRRERVIALPLIGHSVRIRNHAFPKLGLSIHWDDGRFGTIDLDTLDIRYVSD
jgi:hypothetical protein